ncbi:hypothetical protein JAAARDRAFT_191287 [Jaapia argillacea MUCL 33604]|uniref:Prolyl 4-hydroxylase alpha subunit Fe(2+) 2OG dioxygenase domain-containing protein n=1 Tax=Jaapia argillacea MUCL 33604 TaxID=933084 RepID=A0A067Q4U1_9AGAM|nr:hypothetical protein JAAARDRAFT_191287 [Jaapia argillacea MUCL 33604]
MDEDQSNVHHELPNPGTDTSGSRASAGPDDAEASRLVEQNLVSMPALATPSDISHTAEGDSEQVDQVVPDDSPVEPEEHRQACLAIGSGVEEGEGDVLPADGQAETLLGSELPPVALHTQMVEQPDSEAMVIGDDGLDPSGEEEGQAGDSDSHSEDTSGSDDESDGPSIDNPSVNIRDDLEEALEGSLEFKGSFSFDRSYPDAPNPLLRLADLGNIGLPLSEREAQVIKTRCIQAPFGQGERTVVDTAVRDTWEMDANQVSFDNPRWAAFLDGVVRDVCAALGVDFAISQPRCELYKLLLYETGSHFLPHQDTEKANGMFATIIIVLPSRFTGGAAHLSHGGLSKVVDSSSQSRSQTTVLAWYTDVTHEIKPITSGFRLALSFNLVHTTNALRPVLPATHECVNRLRNVLLSWKRDAKEGEESCPEKIMCLLQHKYAQAGLKASALKGIDAHKMALLDLLAKELGFRLGLASVECHLSGCADDEFGYRERDRWRRCSEEASEGMGDEVSMAEVSDRDMTVTKLTDLDGNLLRNDLPCDAENETIPSDLEEVVEQGPHDKQEYEGYMGNGAGSLERWYRRTVLVIWPDENHFAIVYSGGNFQLALNQLRDSPSTKPTKMEVDLLEYILLAAILGEHPRANVLKVVCGVACKWEDRDLWLRAVVACGGDKSFAGPGNGNILKGVETFGFEPIRPIIERILRQDPSNTARYAFLNELEAFQPPDETMVSWLEVQHELVTRSLAQPGTHEKQLLVDIAKKYGGLKFLKDVILPQVITNAGPQFLLGWAILLHDQRNDLAPNEADISVLAQITSDLISLSISKTNFFAVVQPKSKKQSTRLRYQIAHQLEGAPSPGLALAAIQGCIQTGHTDLMQSIFQKLANRPTSWTSELGQRWSSLVLLPLIRSLSGTEMRPRISSMPHLPALCQSTVEWCLDNRKTALSKDEFSAILTAVVMGGPRLKLFSTLVIPRVKSLPCHEQTLRQFITELEARKDELGALADSDLPVSTAITELVTLIIRQAYISPQSVIDCLRLCHDTGNAALYTLVMQRALQSSGSAQHLTQVLVPLLPALRGFLAKIRLPPTEEPFASTYKNVMMTWLRQNLGRRPDEKGATKVIDAVKKLPCDCDPCKRVVKFLTAQHERTLRLDRIGAPKRRHVESNLSSHCRAAATWEMIHTTPQGLTVTKTDLIFSPVNWRASHLQAMGILKTISSSDVELRSIFASQYAELVQRLNGEATTGTASSSTSSSLPGLLAQTPTVAPMTTSLNRPMPSTFSRPRTKQTVRHRIPSQLIPQPHAAAPSASTSQAVPPAVPIASSSTTHTPKKRKEFHPDDIIDLCTP